MNIKNINQEYGRRVLNKAGLKNAAPPTKPFSELFNEPLPMSEITQEQKDHFERENEITREMRASSSNEEKFQKICIEWLEEYIEKNAINLRYDHTANQVGGYRGIKAKSMGHTAGMPDLVFYKVKRGIRANNQLFGENVSTEMILYCGLFIELKTPKGKVQDHQIKTHEYLRKEGYKVEVVRDYKTFKQTIIDYLSDE